MVAGAEQAEAGDAGVGQKDGHAAETKKDGEG